MVFSAVNASLHIPQRIDDDQKDVRYASSRVSLLTTKLQLRRNASTSLRTNSQCPSVDVVGKVLQKLTRKFSATQRFFYGIARIQALLCLSSLENLNTCTFQSPV